jgi:hypothetical protein
MKKLLFLVFFIPQALWATTRMVSPSGTNTGNCSVLSCRTIAYTATQMVAADTLTMGSGTYTEGFAYNEFPDGTDDAHHTIIQTAAGATVIINGQESNGFVAAVSGAYKTFAGPGLTFDAISTTGHVALYMWATAPVPAHHILFQDVEFENAVGGTAGNITAGGNGDEVHDIIFRRIISHHAVGGTPTSHCFYAHMRSITVEDSLFYDCAGYGIQQYTGVGGIGLDNNTFQRNIIRNTGQDGTTYGGMYAASGDNDRFINNLVYNSGGPGSGIQISATTNLLLYSNTFAGFRPAPGVSGCARETASGTNIGAIAKNNVCWDNGGTNTFFGSGWTHSNDVCGSGCTSSSDPLFVDAAAGNFHLQAGSSAATIGADLSVIFTTDLDGTPRTVPWSAGAFVANVPPSKYRGFFAFF